MVFPQILLQDAPLPYPVVSEVLLLFSLYIPPEPAQNKALLYGQSESEQSSLNFYQKTFSEPFPQSFYTIYYKLLSPLFYPELLQFLQIIPV